MKIISRPTFGIFKKLAVTFILIGLFPLFLISNFYLGRFTDNTNEIILNDAELVLKSTSGYVDTMLQQWEDDSAQIYEISVDNGVYLGEVLTDTNMSEQTKGLYMKRFFSSFRSIAGLKSIRFLDSDGKLYYSSEIVGKVVNSSEMKKWKSKELADPCAEHGIMLDPVHQDIYFSNINNDVITVQRNLYDVTSLHSVDTLLGTLYLDIGEEVIEKQLLEIDLGSQSGFYIIDQNATQIYVSKGQKSLSKICRLNLIEESASNECFYQDDEYYYLTQNNKSGGWISVLKIYKGDIISNIRETRQYIIALLAVSTVVLLFLYFSFSRRISVPIQGLIEGMLQIQKGNLDTRLEVKGKDEVGILAEGLNQMAAQLSIYIEQVYGAEIKQREAELQALKSQIKPHYLYNTLDVIRMTAIQHNDRETAEMIECLARQLRYLMGGEAEYVLLQQELNNVWDYFSLMQIRYGNKIQLKSSVSKMFMKVKTPKLILQPVVENAVKHGLKLKEEGGTIWISASEQEGRLEINVMDNGIGMNEQTLQDLRGKLEAGTTVQSENGGVGLANVKERIEKRYGGQYGVQIESTENTGTIVVISIPCIMKEELDV